MLLRSVSVSVPDRDGVPWLELPVFGSNLPYNIVFVDGLGPVQAEVVTSDFALWDGVRLQNSRVLARNIVLTLELRPGVGASNARSALSVYFSPKNRVSLKFEDPNFTLPEVYTNGVVESFEVSLFSRTPMAQISILCFDPYFYGPEQTFTSSTKNVQVSNIGNVSTGFRLLLQKAKSDLTSYSLEVDSGAASSTFAVEVSPTSTGILLNSEPMSRSVSNTAGVGLLGGVVPGTTWPMLPPGDGTIRQTWNGSATATTTVWVLPKFVGL